MALAPRDYVSGILNTIRGQFTPRSVPEPAAVKQSRMITSETENDALLKGTRISASTGSGRQQNLLSSTALGQQMFMDSAQRELENRMIMEMFPDLERNAQYLIASCFSPIDLNITKIAVSSSSPGLTSDQSTKIQQKLTDYFERRLELSTELPDIWYNAGFITGGELIVTVPRLSVKQSFDQIISTESLGKTIDTLPSGGFTNEPTNKDVEFSMESFCEKHPEVRRERETIRTKMRRSNELDAFLEGAISTESLTLTDNVGSLSIASGITEHNDSLRAKRTADLVNMRVTTKPQPVGVLRAPTPTENLHVLGEPLTLRIATKSCFFVFPPGAPDKPTAAIIILDETGAPINIGSYGGISTGGMVGGATTASLFQDVGQATTSTSNTDYMKIEGQRQLQALYRTFMSSYISSKVSEAGYGSISIGESDAVMKSMFFRYLEKRTTRLLIIPRQYFTYFAHGIGQNGIGMTKIEGIKKYLVMKMIVLVSRVMAAMRAAADTRKITVTVDTANMVPEEIIQANVLNAYCAKNLLDLDSLDFQSIQTRIIAAALQIDVKTTQGTSAYSVDNESTTQGKASLDFDPELLSYLDSQINNKVPVPASLTSSLDEPELATTITTANLFYSMKVSLEQRLIKKYGSSWVRQYSRDSQEVRDIIRTVIGTKEDAPKKDEFTETGSLGADTKESSGLNVDDVIDDLMITLPKPIISKNTAQFTSLSSMVDAVSKIVDIMYPDSFAGGDQDQVAALTAMKAAAMREGLSELSAGAGITQMDLGNISPAKALQDVLSFRDKLANQTKAMADQKAATTPVDNSTGGSDTSGGDSGVADGYGSPTGDGYV